jgi:hypothetical protein
VAIAVGEESEGEVAPRKGGSGRGSRRMSLVLAVEVKAEVAVEVGVETAPNLELSIPLRSLWGAEVRGKSAQCSRQERRKGATYETMVTISPLRANRIASTDSKRRKLRAQKVREDLVRKAILGGIEDRRAKGRKGKTRGADERRAY